MIWWCLWLCDLFGKVLTLPFVLTECVNRSMLVILLETQYCDCDSFWTMFHSRLLANLYFSCGALHRTPIPGDSLHVFFWLSNDPRLPPVLRGWCKGWKINRRPKGARKEKPHNHFKNQFILSKPRVQCGSERFTVTRPVSQFGSGNDRFTLANRSKGKFRYMANHFVLEHVLLLILSILRQQEGTECFVKIE
jgi:hypothetical protein